MIAILAVLIFVGAYILIATERIHRTAAALGGAGLMLLIHATDAEGAFFAEESAIDWNVIFLLLGMMVIVGVLKPTGVFEYLAIWAARRARGRPFRLMVLLSVITAVASALLDNVTTVLLIAPVTFVVCERLALPVAPYLLAEVFASNIGGTATLIGDPPNIIIAGSTDLSFNSFIVNLAPAVVITLGVIVGALYLVFRSRLQIDERNRDAVLELDARASIRDWDELRRSVPVLVLTILAFFAHQALHIEPATVALTGAAVALLITRLDLEDVLAGIEWPTLFFFVGLFVIVGALEETGAIDEVARATQDLTGGDRTAELLGIVWIAGIGSGVVDNIPFTTAMIPVVESLQGDGLDDAYWWALSLGACFGGNATIIAAAANVAAAGLAERAGRPIGFMRFLAVGVPATLASLVLATAYVALRYIA